MAKLSKTGAPSGGRQSLGRWLFRTGVFEPQMLVSALCLEKKTLVSWDDYSIYYGIIKHVQFQTTNQLLYNNDNDNDNDNDQLFLEKAWWTNDNDLILSTITIRLDNLMIVTL